MGAVIEGEDPQAYADMTGFPLALTMVLDKIVLEMRNPERAKAFAIDWLERTPVGADLSKVTGETIVHLLDDPAVAEIAKRSPDVEAGRQAVLDLHRRTIAGETLGRQDWKTVRQAAVAASDAAEDVEVTKAARMVEAAAWPTSMGSVLGDTLGARTGLDQIFALKKIGWTDDDEREVNVRLEAAEASTGRTIRGVPACVEALAETDKEFARRFQERIDAFPEFTASSGPTGAFIVERLSSAPIASREPEVA
jgi:hypothetical protein